jgi:hypothetical protein
MSELLVRLAAPAVVIVIEHEGPTRLVSTATTAADGRALERWLAASPLREAAVEAALADRSLRGGAARGRAWAREISVPGIVAALEAALAGEVRLRG